MTFDFVWLQAQLSADILKSEKDILRAFLHSLVTVAVNSQPPKKSTPPTNEKKVVNPFS